MTTIAYRDGVMAADSGSWQGGASHPWANKLAKGADGVLYGVCGNAPEAMGFLAWVEGGYRGEQPKPEPLPDGGNAYLVLAVAPGGPIRIIGARGEESYDAPYFALGAGAPTAFGAFYAGATAQIAIDAAKEHGEGAFGAVRTISHEGTHG